MLDKLYDLLPSDSATDFEYVVNGILSKFKDGLKNTHQELSWHGEDDVLTHTLMVLSELINLDEYKALTKKEQLVVFLAACFHDVGKITCTKVIDGVIRSFHHGATGAKMVRAYLYKDLKIGGSKELIEFREAICLLIKYHSNPVYLANDENCEKRILKLAANSFLTPLFNIKLLSILSTADVKGRIGNEKEEQVSKINSFIDIAKKLGVYETYYPFENNYTKFQYLNTSNNIWHGTKLYDSSWQEVIIMCGIPGTGKDTFIKKYYPNHAVICLDDIRNELKLKPKENESKVYEVAKTKAKNYLRNNIPFIWNATSITPLTRGNNIELFHDYKAYVKIIYLETNYDECIIRNNNRQRTVPIDVINKMIDSLVIPESYEAEEVCWICV